MKREPDSKCPNCGKVPLIVEYEDITRFETACCKVEVEPSATALIGLLPVKTEVTGLKKSGARGGHSPR